MRSASGLGDSGGHDGVRERPGPHDGVLVRQLPVHQDVGKCPELPRAFSCLTRRGGGPNEHLVHPVLENLISEFFSVPKVPVEAAGGHAQLTRQARDSYARSAAFQQALDCGMNPIVGSQLLDASTLRTGCLRERDSCAMPSSLTR
jgi:hypothetical protein